MNYTDPEGLEVTIWSRDPEIPFPFDSVGEHQWIQTDKYESGMGMPGNRVPGQNNNSGYPGMPTETVDHRGQSLRPGSKASAPPFPVDEECVNREIKQGQKTGRWLPPYNDCNTFVKEVLEKCRKRRGATRSW